MSTTRTVTKLATRCLREVAHLIEGQLREYDFLARYGGDEFVALVQEVVGAQVEDLCMRIESAVSKFSLAVGKNRFARVGISIGTATFGVDGETLDQLVVAADNEMYRMKSSHRSAADHGRVDHTMSSEICSNLVICGINLDISSLIAFNRSEACLHDVPC